MPVAGLATGQYGAVGNIECGKQRRSAVTNAVVGYALHVPEPHGLRTLRCLALALGAVFDGNQQAAKHEWYFAKQRWK